MKTPKLYVIAGPNGSGKTTFAEKFLPHYVGCFEFVNADLIAKGLSPFAPSNVAIKAGKILLDQVRECARRKVDFAVETTLAGKTQFKVLESIKRNGYELHMFFLWVPDVKLALARVADRVRKGGHDVLERDVLRRYFRGLRNLFCLYQRLFESWSVFDNSTEKPRQIAKFERGVLAVLDAANYERLFNQAKHAHGI